MKNSTLYLPGFSHQLRGRLAGAQPARRLRDDAHRLDGLAALVARFIPPEMLVAGAAGRERVFTAWVTFVAFLGQVLTRGGTCREAVRRVQAWSVSLKRAVPDDSTSAYCQARARLPLESLHKVHERLGEWMARHQRETWKWCARSVKVLDGCGVSMPDTQEAQKRRHVLTLDKTTAARGAERGADLFWLTVAALETHLVR